jgi:hypothetical protein
MTQINQLTALDTLAGGDQLAVYSASNGDARKSSITVLQSYMQSNLTFSQSTFTTEYSSPLTGATVTIATASGNAHLIVTPAGTIAALTIKLPAVAGLVDKQEILVNCTQIVTTLTMDANGATAILGAPSTLASANEYFRLKYDALMTTWYRVG